MHAIINRHRKSATPKRRGNSAYLRALSVSQFPRFIFRLTFIDTNITTNAVHRYNCVTISRTKKLLCPRFSAPKRPRLLSFSWTRFRTKTNCCDLCNDGRIGGWKVVIFLSVFEKLSWVFENNSAIEGNKLWCLSWVNTTQIHVN